MFTVDGYRVKFEYANMILPFVHHKDFIRKPADITFCIIISPDNTVQACCPVVRYYKDQNNRNNARKYSLTHALDMLFPGKENKQIRAKFWNAYFEKLGKVK